MLSCLLHVRLGGFAGHPRSEAALLLRPRLALTSFAPLRQDGFRDCVLAWHCIYCTIFVLVFNALHFFVIVSYFRA
jgi:hypothetical protein